MEHLAMLLSTDSAEVVFRLIAVLAGIAIIVISIKWVINSFKAFKAIEEIRKDVNIICNHVIERDRVQI